VKRKQSRHDFVLTRLFDYGKELFTMGEDTDEKGTLESVRRSIEFRGITVWTLIFAVFIASIGLNTNSTAVIIGAMLVSPLMGPITGAGLSMGIYDFEMLKKSLRNLVIMTLIALVTSFLYFAISPLKQAQSELLARTYPTIYDVLIAVFGGATGIIASTRKEKSLTAIPGVAIATALMPPLCTAGYGLATGQIRYFLGAIYLYLINSVFIGLTAFIVVRFLAFRKATYVNKDRETKIHRYISIVAIVVLLPSIYLAWGLIRQETESKSVQTFISRNFNFPKSKVLSSSVVSDGGGKAIEVTVIGEPVTPEMRTYLEGQMKSAGLGKYRLKIIQSEADHGGKADAAAIQVYTLEQELAVYRYGEDSFPLIRREVAMLFPEVERLRLATLRAVTAEGDMEKEIAIMVEWKKAPGADGRVKLRDFLRSRLNLPELNLYEYSRRN
jgi:uncharacterized hydrophobic protein (TIGR00271 family)